MYIVNGRFEKGDYTYHGLLRNRPINSTVDYLISSYDNFNVLNSFCVCPLSEFSDHSAITFNLQSKHIPVQANPCGGCSDKIVWDTSKRDQFLRYLNNNTFNDIIYCLSSDELNIDQCISEFSKLMYDISFKFYGKTINVKQHLSNTKRSAVLWFDSVCKQSKSAFYSAKRKCSNDPTP